MRRAPKNIKELPDDQLQKYARAHDIDPEGLTRAQLINAIHRESEDFVKGELLAATMILLVVLFGLVLFSGIRESHNRKEQDAEIADILKTLHDNQIKACQQSLAPGGVRFVVANQIRDKIKQSETTDYSMFFPNVDPETLRKLIEAQTARDRTAVHELLDVDCEALYKL